jgi:hypothetical protein
MTILAIKTNRLAEWTFSRQTAKTVKNVLLSYPSTFNDDDDELTSNFKKK